jgi:hypothetical protein
VHLPPFFEKKADAAPGELQLNSEILFFAKAQRRRAYRCRWSRIGVVSDPGYNNGSVCG